MGYLVLLLLPALAIFVLARRRGSRHPFALAMINVVLTPVVAIGMFLILPQQLVELTEQWYTPQGGGDPFGMGMLVAVMITAAAVGMAVSLCLVALFSLIGGKKSGPKGGGLAPERDRLANAP